MGTFVKNLSAVQELVEKTEVQMAPDVETKPKYPAGSDAARIAALSYEELVMHFARAPKDHPWHRGVLGKVFSESMDYARAKLTPEQVAQVHASV